MAGLRTDYEDGELILAEDFNQTNRAVIGGITEAAQQAEAAAQAAADTSANVEQLREAIEELPDGQAVSAKVAEHTTQISDINDGIDIGNDTKPSDVMKVQSNEYIHVVTDSNGRIIEATDNKGTKTLFGKLIAEIVGYVKSVQGKSLIDEVFSNSISRTSNPEFIEAKLDNEGRLIYGIKNDGDFYFGKGVPKQILDLLADFDFDIDIEALDEIVAKVNTLTTDVEGIKDTVEQIQPVVINNEGTINNQADGVDLVSENNVIHLANRTAILGRGYKIIRQVVSPATLNDQFNQSNTIYDIRIDMSVTADLSIPANSVLWFNGGKFVDDGTHTITLNNTLIQGEGGFDGCKVRGTVLNSEIRSEWFVNDGIDFSDNYISIVEIANASSRPIIFRKDTYSILASKLSIGGMLGFLICNQSIDYGDSELILNVDLMDFRLIFSNTTAVSLKSGGNWDADLINAIRNHDVQFPASFTINSGQQDETIVEYPDTLIMLTSNEIELYRALGEPSYTQKKQEYIYIDKSGQRTNEIFSPKYNPNAQEDYSIHPDKVDALSAYKCITPLSVKNVHMKIIDTYTGQDKLSNYRYIGFYLFRVMHVTFSNVIIDCSINDSCCIYNYVTRGYDIDFNNFKCAPTTSDRTIVGQNKSAYVFMCGGVINLKMSDFRCSDMTGQSWGSTGTNFVYNWYINRCSFNRIDAHMRVNNLYLSNSIIGSRHLCYSGTGDIIIDKCTFYGNEMITPREDYLGFFDGDITIRDCKVISSNNLDIHVLELHTWDKAVTIREDDEIITTDNVNNGMKYHAKYMGARNLVIDNLLVESETTENVKVYLVHFYANQTGNYIEGMRMPNISANNVRCVHGNSISGMSQSKLFIHNVPVNDYDWFGTEVFKYLFSNIDFGNSGLFELSFTANTHYNGNQSIADTTYYSNHSADYPTRNVSMSLCENYGTIVNINNLTVKEASLTTIISTI